MSNRTSNTSKLEQGRANYDFECAENANKELGQKKMEYKAYAKKLPMLIKTNGIGAAMAFAFSKSGKSGVPDINNPWGLLYVQIENWLNKEDGLLLFKFEKNRLAKGLTEVDSGTYKAVTIEVLALLSWIRRFAEGLIDGNSSN